MCMDWIDKPQNYKGLYGILQLLQGSHLNNFPLKTLKLGWIDYHYVEFQFKCLDFPYNQYRKLAPVLSCFCNGLLHIQIACEQAHLLNSRAKGTQESEEAGGAGGENGALSCVPFAREFNKWACSQANIQINDETFNMMRILKRGQTPFPPLLPLIWTTSTSHILLLWNSFWTNAPCTVGNHARSRCKLRVNTSDLQTALCGTNDHSLRAGSLVGGVSWAK